MLKRAQISTPSTVNVAIEEMTVGQAAFWTPDEPVGEFSDDPVVAFFVWVMESVDVCDEFFWNRWIHLLRKNKKLHSTNRSIS